MIKFKEKKKDRISVIENSIHNILDTLKNLWPVPTNLTDTQEDIIKNYEYLRNKFNMHKHRIYTRYSTGSPIL